MIEVAQAAGSALVGRTMIQESIEFLQWLTDDSFIYLGYREYRISGTGEDATIAVVPGSGLGIMSDDARSRFAKPVPVAELDPAVRDRFFGGPLAGGRQDQPRDRDPPARADGLHRRQAGGRRRQGGRRAAHDRPLHQQGLRRVGPPDPAGAAQARGDHALGGSDHRARTTTRPWSSSSTASRRTSSSRRRPRSCARPSWRSRRCRRSATCACSCASDPMRRTVWAMVALPRDRVSTELRLRLEHLFEYRFEGVVADYALSFATDPARFHFTIHVGDGGFPTSRSPTSSARWSLPPGRGTTRSPMRWPRRSASMRGHELARRYAALFPEYYKSAADDRRGPVRRASSSSGSAPDRPYVVALQNERGPAEPLTRVKLYKTGGKAPLTELLPLLEQLGLTVVEEVPTRLQGDPAESRYLHDFGVLGPDGEPARPGRLRRSRQPTRSARSGTAGRARTG